MMKKYLATFLTIGTSLCAENAPQEFPFKGFFTGASIGYGFSNSKIDQTQGGTNNPSTVLSIRGAAGGLHAGYDWQIMDRWVVGVEAQWMLMNAHGSNQVNTTNGGNRAISEFYQKQSMNGAVRLGYAFDKTLFYLKGGLSSGDFMAKGTNGAVHSSQSFRKRGYVVGAGIETLVSSHVTAGLEFTHERYKQFKMVNKDVLATNYTFNPDASRIQVRLSYRF